MGMAGSDGQIFDFSGAPFGNGSGEMMVGDVVRYVRLTPTLCRRRRLDEAVEEANGIYSERMHNIFCDNCHSHVAVALEHAEYRGIGRWNMVMLAIWVFFAGKYVNVCAFIKHWLPFAVVLGLVHWSQSRPKGGI